MKFGFASAADFPDKVARSVFLKTLSELSHWFISSISEVKVKRKMISANNDYTPVSEKGSAAVGFFSNDKLQSGEYVERQYNRKW